MVLRGAFVLVEHESNTTMKGITQSPLKNLSFQEHFQHFWYDQRTILPRPPQQIPGHHCIKFLDLLLICTLYLFLIFTIL